MTLKGGKLSNIVRDGVERLLNEGGDCAFQEPAEDHGFYCILFRWVPQAHDPLYHCPYQQAKIKTGLHEVRYHACAYRKVKKERNGGIQV